MWIKKKGRKLSREILEYLLLACCIGVFAFFFFYLTADSIAEVYLTEREITAGEQMTELFHLWLRNICGFAAMMITLFLFLFLLGQRLSYLITIIDGVEELRGRKLEFILPVEGEDELAELAESINFLAQSQQELQKKEQELKKEREEWIRTLSHDIRTPLTSILASTSFLQEQKNAISPGEIQEYLALVQAKAQQIKVLTDQLMGGAAGKKEEIEDLRLLISQLAMEWEEILEDRFECRIHTEMCREEAGAADLYALRRIFDNLASNVEKYADPDYPVTLTGENRGEMTVLIQENRKRKDGGAGAESQGIGMKSIAQIAAAYGGKVDVRETAQWFSIEISLNLKTDLQNSSETSEDFFQKAVIK